MVFAIAEFEMTNEQQVQAFLIAALLLELVQFVLHAHFVVGDVAVPQREYPFIDTVSITLRGSLDLGSMIFACTALMLTTRELNWFEMALVALNATTHMWYIAMYYLPVQRLRGMFYQTVALSFAFFTKYPITPGASVPGFSLGRDGSYVFDWTFIPYVSWFLAYHDLFTHIYLSMLVASFIRPEFLLPIALGTAYVAGERITKFQRKVRRAQRVA